MPRHATREVPGPDVPGHAAVQAWGRLRPGAGVPRAVDILCGFRTKAWKRTVYRLDGAGPAGSAVIAKRCPAVRARVERTVYEEVLPHFPLPTLRYYGSVEGPENAFCWLFLEDAGGQEYSPLRGEHRTLAGRWLGLLHTSAARLDVAARLPDRGPGHYLGHLRSARATLRRHLVDPRLSASDVAVLRSIVSRCDALESGWGQVEEWCGGMPRTLVHADFKAKNLRVRTGADGPALFPFDWETGGWGVPAPDLGSSANPDVAAYRAAVRAHWPGLDIQALQRLVHVGKVFRNLAGIDWAAQGLPHDWTEEAMQKLRIYESRQADLMGASER
jgi:hypothetical protein